jgi:uncharacterized protein (TIGR00255 family)
MPYLASMTGFARATGSAGDWRYAWEIKTVNGRGLDLRLRVPAGFDAIGEQARRGAGEALKRGNGQITLTVTRDETPPALRVNEAALRSLLDALARTPLPANIAPPTMDGLLAVRGIIETIGATDDDSLPAHVELQLVDGFEQALAALLTARRAEGAALMAVLSEQLDRIAMLTAQADASPARKPEAIKARLAEQIAALAGTGVALDSARLHQEAILIATKADIREEIDRLIAHVAAARALLSEGGPVGRRLDFLAQELGRESNTLCAKAGDMTLSAIGLDLKAVVEQFREQVQNVE